MDRHDRRALAIPGVLMGLRAMVSRNESGLPVMAMDDVDRKTQPLDGFDDRSRKETIASAVITEGTVDLTEDSEIQEALYAGFPANLMNNEVASSDWLF